MDLGDHLYQLLGVLQVLVAFNFRLIIICTFMYSLTFRFRFNFIVSFRESSTPVTKSFWWSGSLQDLAVCLYYACGYACGDVFVDHKLGSH